MDDMRVLLRPTEEDGVVEEVVATVRGRFDVISASK